MIIGLTGAARSGKDTIADVLVARGWEKMALADPIYAAMHAMFGWSREWIEQHKEEPVGPCGRSPRYLMQTLGTEWGRQLVGESVWCDVLRARLRARTDTDVVIPGVRFDDEAKLIHSLGGFVIKVYRPDAPKVHAHESEKGVDRRLLDAAVVNDGTVERLVKNVFAVIDALSYL